MFPPDKKEEKPKKTSILTVLGIGGPKEEDGEEMPSDEKKMALKSAFESIKEDDFDGFFESMTHWIDCGSDD